MSSHEIYDYTGGPGGGGGGWGCLIGGVALVLVVAFIAVTLTAGNHNTAVQINSDHSSISQIGGDSTSIQNDETLGETVMSLSFAFLIAVLAIMGTIGLVGLALGNGGRR